MQVRFRTTTLERAFASLAAGTRAWGAEVARRYVERITILRAAETIEDLYRIPPLRFHPLKGDRRGQFALRLTDRIRLIVTITQATPPVVWIEEVSKHYDD